MGGITVVDLEARVLCVDDEPNVLDGLRRSLRGHVDVTTAVGGAAGLETIEREGPFAVVVSDLRMPGMDGVAFLSRVRAMAPDTVRVLLTGQADLDAAIAAVNDGWIFRFLSKPCPPEVLLKALDAAFEQYRLITSERVLLERTLYGSIKMLTDILALVVPTALARAQRAKQHVGDLAIRLDVPARWQVEVAAMLSQIGYVTVSMDLAKRIYQGHLLSEDEQAIADRLPAVAEGLLASIPRLEPIREILAYQKKRYDGSGEPCDSIQGDVIPWGARALKIALDFDELLTRGFTAALALDTMRGRKGWYDPDLLQAFAELPAVRGRGATMAELPLRSVEVGMVFMQDVKTTSGVTFIACGQEMTPSLRERVRNLPRIVEVVEPVCVAVWEEPEPAPAADVLPELEFAHR
jgi:response regulator RpfG family c-di-GMP phosphodiesterase